MGPGAPLHPTPAKLGSVLHFCSYRQSQKLPSDLGNICKARQVVTKFEKCSDLKITSKGHGTSENFIIDLECRLVV